MKRIADYLVTAAVGAGLLAASPAWAQMASPASSWDPPLNQQRVPADTRVHRVHGQRYVYQSYPASGAYGTYPSNSAYGYPYAAAYGYGYPDTGPYGYPYASAYGYSNDSANPFSMITAPITALTAPVTALTAPVAQVATAPFAAAAEATSPMITGRSVATGQMGKMCSTPVKSCELYQSSWVGNGCSCKIPGGRARGSVSP